MGDDLASSTLHKLRRCTYEPAPDRFQLTVPFKNVSEAKNVVAKIHGRPIAVAESPAVVVYPFRRRHAA